jgi:hypothetical protein
MCDTRMQPRDRQSSTATQLSDTVDGVPNVGGVEELIAQTLQGRELARCPLLTTTIRLAGIRS